MQTIPFLRSSIAWSSATAPRASAGAAARGLPVPQAPGYELQGKLGRGGMSVVYKARQLSLGRLVALKVLLAGSHSSASALTRFRAEAEAIARLQHPPIVQVHEIGAREPALDHMIQRCSELACAGVGCAPGSPMWPEYEVKLS
jgi:serine/threonine protein kinase